MSKKENAVVRFGKWLDGKSEIYSRLCGEDFTRWEVLMANVGLLLFYIGIGMAENHPILSVVIIGIIAICVFKQKDEEGKHA